MNRRGPMGGRGGGQFDGGRGGRGYGGRGRGSMDYGRPMGGG
eukprot:CAMPEP_0201675640 /NCGR_PEP_ID=MMETSP0494-20130426/39994_1 /ASSEMBLY_ACC=CAM_ASM_000839 /TAXON_ID=420259 /ORGANISM="Thalassiosira gravida, Strain GMp14c1" /LENGTH=41 /DNA_ID= /DNA_START= /DNA_END= /DNA_ORIENTATION=